MRIVNETEQDFKKLCAECVASGDVATLTTLRPYFDSYRESPSEWSEDDADGNHIIIKEQAGNLLRYRYSVNDENNMMTLTPDEGLPHVYVRITSSQQKPPSTP